MDRMHIHRNHAEKESNGQLAESLSQFGSVKIEFIITGRNASKNLIQERRFDEAVRVCEMVLAVDPEDLETSDLKERAIVYINNPDQFDLHEMQKMMSRPGGDSSSPQRLLRSASERRVRKSDGGALISASSLNGHGPELSSDNNNNPNHNSGGIPSERKSEGVKLRRSQSEMHRPNVLERIKEFERQAKNISNEPAPSRPIDLKEISSEPEITIIENPRIVRQLEPKSAPAPNLVPKDISQSFAKRPDALGKLSTTSEIPTRVNAVATITTVSTPSNGPRPVRIPRRADFNLPKRVEIGESTPDNVSSQLPTYRGIFNKGKADTLSPVSEDVVGLNSFKTEDPVQLRQNGTHVVRWTELGKTVKSNLRGQLETNFFTSSLIRKACIITTNSDVWVCFGWNHVRKQEFDTLLKGMANQSYLTSSKLRLDGIEFSCLSGTNTVVRGRVKKLGVNCTKLNNILVIVVYVHPVLPREIAMLVRNFGALIEKNQPLYM